MCKVARQPIATTSGSGRGRLSAEIDPDGGLPIQSSFPALFIKRVKQNHIVPTRDGNIDLKYFSALQFIRRRI